MAYIFLGGVGMKKIVPFSKDILFDSNIAQVNSISLDHSLKLKENNLVSLEFVVSGSYKMTSASLTVDNFEYKLPFDISIDGKYNTDNIVIDINDFYYEVKDDKILSIDIEVSIDGLTENERSEEVKEENEEVILEDNLSKSVFSNLDDGERYVTYKVHVVLENDTALSIAERYGVTRETLAEYNNLDNLTVFDKVIIPAHES